MIYVYVLQGLQGKRYVGITNNLERRLKEHGSGNTKGGRLLVIFNYCIPNILKIILQPENGKNISNQELAVHG
jgi:hypothetical protein